MDFGHAGVRHVVMSHMKKGWCFAACSNECLFNSYLRKLTHPGEVIGNDFQILPHLEYERISFTWTIEIFQDAKTF